jgi:pyruvate/2-oxoglutarate dehydrogenase complex dihydrolipoamide dehydrogenase (E3) component
MHLVRVRAAEFGVRGVNPDALWFDLPATVARKDRIIQSIIDGIYGWVNRDENITFIRGRAEFTAPVDIRVDGHKIRADKSVIATGSRPADVRIPGLTEAGYITNYEALQLQELPSSLIIIGAGYVGVEFAQMYSRFGTRVTLLSRSPRIMQHEEPDLSELLGGLLTAEGIELCLSATAIRAEMEGKEKVVVAEIEGHEQQFNAEEILLAVGRIPRVDGLGLEQAGVEMGPHGIQVDGSLRTTAGNIWSLGDVNGGAMFTHRATYDGPITALNAVRGAGRTVDYRVVPRAIFSQPALASVGFTEHEAIDAGYGVKTGVSYFKHLGRAKAIGETAGLVKLVADVDTDQLLGGHILGPHADDLIHEIAVVMYNDGTAEPLYRSIHIHPTLSEVIKDAAKQLR